jgi:hypothetical protein
MDASAQKALDVLGLMRLEDGRCWSETAVAYQREHAAAIVSRDAPQQTWVELPRGGRKTTDISGLVLAMLREQAPPMARAYIGASDLEQAMEVIDAGRGMIERTPELEHEFRVTDLVITSARTGASMTALPADASAYGKRAWLVVLDEVSNWPEIRKARRFWSTLMSGNRKLAECRTVVISNSGDPSHWTFRRREVARTSPHWRFFSVPGPLPWLTPTDLEILRENAETPSEFDRLHMNVWTASEDRLASIEDLRAATTLPGSLPPVPGKQYVVTLDIGHTFDPTVMAVMHAEERPGGRRAVLDAIYRWHGRKSAPVDLIEVSRSLVDVATRYNRAAIVLDPYSGRQAAQEARAAGLVATEFAFNATSVGRLALSLHQAIRRHVIDLPADQELIDELASVRLIKNTVGVYRLDSATTRTHDDQAVVLALGVHHLLDAEDGPQFPILDAPEQGLLDRFGIDVLRPCGQYALRPDSGDEWASAGRADEDTERPRAGAVQHSPWA